jgi:4-hydroxybenzoate polyprenyltransferase
MTETTTEVPIEVKPARSMLSLYLDLIRWNRPAGWLLLLWPSLGALWLASGGFPGWHLLAVFVLGTILMRSAG